MTARDVESEAVEIVGNGNYRLALRLIRDSAHCLRAAIPSNDPSDPIRYWTDDLEIMKKAALVLMMKSKWHNGKQARRFSLASFK